ncbi:hypothetical protein Ancab_012776 [Ancistrocladus abbreviatus]
MSSNSGWGPFGDAPKGGIYGDDDAPEVRSELANVVVHGLGYPQTQAKVLLSVTCQKEIYADNDACEVCGVFANVVFHSVTYPQQKVGFLLPVTFRKEVYVDDDYGLDACIWSMVMLMPPRNKVIWQPMGWFMALGLFFHLALLAGLPTTISAAAMGFNYVDALNKSLLFFEAQRSGQLPQNQKVKWRGDSGQRDGYLQGLMVSNFVGVLRGGLNLLPKLMAATFNIWRLHLLLMMTMQMYLLASSTTSALMTFNYSNALDKSLMFFTSLRHRDWVKCLLSKSLGVAILPSLTDFPNNSGNVIMLAWKWQVDLVGGYYDAGDHVKFGLPMAFSVTMLAWAAVDFRSEIVAANQMEHTLQAIQWGTDYFTKAHSDLHVLWAQVGDGESDHCCWERAEDMTTPRTAYRLDSSNPGSDLAGETAAALAAASLAFQPYNSSYSIQLLFHAKQLFSFADTFRGQYDDSIPAAKSFYPSSGYMDELLWAAAWLYRATGNNYYLQYAVDNAVSMGGTGCAVRMFSWDNKYAGLQILLSKVLLQGGGESYSFGSALQQYKAKADFYACAYMQKNNGYNVPMTPGGLAYVLASNNLQYTAAAAFLFTVYSDYLASANATANCPNGQLQPQDLLNFSKSQADYILGNNPQSMSYLVGHGEKYPVHVHHRGSSIPSIFVLPNPVGCIQGFEAWFKNPNPNPNILYGALVGGPDSGDGFSDDRSNYDQNEPSTSAGAPLVGLFAKLQGLYTTSGSPQKLPPMLQTPPGENNRCMF